MNGQAGESMSPVDLPAWQALKAHHAGIAGRHLRDIFAGQPGRARRYAIDAHGLYVDYSRNRFAPETLDLLFALADQSGLKQRIENLFSGAPVNVSEKRPALHTALRLPTGQPLHAGGQDISALVRQELGRMEQFITGLHAGNLRGYSGKPITTVVNIGIGGSDLGPRLVTGALDAYRIGSVEVRFVAAIDVREMQAALRGALPETTLFIISTKSFTTEETLANAASAKEWLIGRGCMDLAKHLAAVTANRTAAREFGVADEYLFNLWDWVGGRYSVWSATGLPAAINIGMDHFREFLAGAHAMDEHFRTQAPARNIPVILGLLDVWYINFFNAAALAVIPYDQALRLLPDYLTQLMMESNGKSVDLENQAVTYQTGAVILGGAGTNAQHSFMQLLHQGTRLIPVDFLAGLGPEPEGLAQHKILLANCIAQGEALMNGTNAAGGDNGPACKTVTGNHPSTTILYDRLTPYTLGLLLALYEHRTFVQACLWNINPFDQWGVELGKKISASVKAALNGKPLASAHDETTRALAGRYMAVTGDKNTK